MSVLVDAERSSTKAKLLLGAMHFVLVIGAISIIYPFLIMLSGSIRCTVDNYDSGLIPHYLYEDDILYQKAIAEKYLGSLASYNRDTGNRLYSFKDVRVPSSFNPKGLRLHFLVTNYKVVIDEILLHGRALLNTLIYCSMSVGAVLTINPFAAYALSRYKPRCQYKVMLFFMLTMAFPGMVLGIPTFLLMRSFGLLNTYWALILPGLASGFSIFLLKGFFDSLPKELYEAAQIDGASELTMFWHITLAMSKPILAVLALSAFVGAYSNFMLAFILCQSPKMWTMMVYLYQLQQRSTPGVSYAALVIASIPTMLVFVFCQRLIIRGIVVPVDR